MSQGRAADGFAGRPRGSGADSHAAATSGFALNEAVTALRTSAAAGLPADIAVEVTGGPAFAADIANAMSSANITLLVVTASVVAVLLVVTYRSPILWLVPLAVIGFADGLSTALGTTVSRFTGLTFDGATAGITSVLVFGAGTNYALLLISRYREELTGTDDHRLALRTAVSRAGPAIVASNATVVLALLTLVFAAAPATRSLGVHAACGLVVAVLLVLLVLPPLLSLFGTRLFWPFIPRLGAHRRSRPVCGTASPMGYRPCRPRRRHVRGGVGADGSRAARHADRVVADRTIPGEGRVGDRL